jgi:hypothetical protein
MGILHIDLGGFGDNSAIREARLTLAAPGRSDSGRGRKIRATALAGAHRIAQSLFASEFGLFLMLARYGALRAAARFRRLWRNTIPFVFFPTPPERSVSTHRRQKTNLAPLLCPQEGRGRSFMACSEQAGFPTPQASGDFP